jgi:pimeloyl-ACP methyl ester carboxylesterase
MLRRNIKPLIDGGRELVRWALLGGCLGLLLSAPAAQAARSGSVVRHVRVNGVRLGYRTVGSGAPLIMIPGFAFTMAEWDPKLIHALAAHHRVVLFDNRGVATSTDSRNRLTIAEMANDTVGLVRALNLGRVDVLGWSMGGYIAQQLALRHPAMVRRLLLASTGPGSIRAIQPSAIVINELQHASQAQLVRLLFPRTGLSAARAWQMRIGEQAAQLHFTRIDFNVSPLIVSQQFLAAGPGWDSRGHGAYDRLPKLRIPTLIMAGVDDLIVPVGNARLLQQRIRHSTLVRYRDAGHAFLFQEPLVVSRRVNSFIAKG